MLLFVIGTGRSLAGGYAIPDLTARAVGKASAVTAGVDDPSAVYFNPAALTQIKGNQVLGGLNYINSVSSVTNSGRRSVNEHDDNFVPSFFGNYHVPTTDLTAGIGLYSPFGLATDYNEKSFTRYAAIQSELKTFYITPAVGWRANSFLSVGGGLSFVRGSTRLSRALFISPLLPDAKLRLTGTDDSFAYNLGVLVQPLDKVKFGLTFKSRSFLKFDGADVKYSDPIGTTTKTKVSSGASVPLPAVVSAGINWQVTPAWSVEFVYDWTKWNDFRNLSASFATPLPVLGVPAIPSILVDEDWKNTSTFRFGSSYRFTQSFELRAGVGLDETPIPGHTLSPSIPGADILALTAGAGYNWRNVAIDFGYAALFYKTRRVTNNSLEGNPALTPGADKYQSFSNFVFLNLGYRF